MEITERLRKKRKAWKSKKVLLQEPEKGYNKQILEVKHPYVACNVYLYMAQCT